MNKERNERQANNSSHLRFKMKREAFLIQTNNPAEKRLKSPKYA